MMQYSLQPDSPKPNQEFTYSSELNFSDPALGKIIIIETPEKKLILCGKESNFYKDFAGEIATHSSDAI